MTTPIQSQVPVLIGLDPNGRLKLHLHPGQREAYKSDAQTVIISAGTQGGKTSFGPLWLLREIRRCGQGDYLIATPTFQLLERKLLGEFVRLFETYLHLGRYYAGPTRVFRFSDEGARRTFKMSYDPYLETTVQFGYAEEPEGLESMTARAAWADECGQHKFKRESYQSIVRRLALARGEGKGRILLTSSLYSYGWLTELMDAAKKDRSIAVIQFDSVMNPNYPRDEFEKARRTLPLWKFNLLYRGVQSRPEGLIYGNFDPHKHLIRRFPIPDHWTRYIGIDFGPVHTAAVFIAVDPLSRRRFIYRTYLEGKRSAPEHVRSLRANEPFPAVVAGGAWSEDNWRDEFTAAGLPVRRPEIRDVEVGIQRVYATLGRDNVEHPADGGLCHLGSIAIFDDLLELKDQLTGYSRVLDVNGIPTDEIEDKAEFHYLDALRYITVEMERPPSAAVFAAPMPSAFRFAERSEF